MKGYLPQKHSLFFKFTGVLFSLLLAFFIIGGSWLLKEIQHQNLKTFKDHAHSVTRMIAGHAAFHLEKFSYFAIEEQTNRLQNQKEKKENEILSILIYNAQGRKVNASGVEHNQIQVPAAYRMRVEYHCIYALPGEKGREVGKAVAVFSLERFFHQARRWQIAFITSGILILILLNLVLAALVIVFIARPLKNLAASTRKIARGEFDAVFHYSGRDEIGNLSSDFNIMAEHLRLYVSEVHELNRTLEQKVEKRTLELAEERNKLKSRNTQMEQELALARKIQQQLIPALPPSENLAALYCPMDQIGGDFYDVFSLPETGSTGIFISDVSGHGIPAALIATMVKSFLLRAGKFLLNPAQTLSYLNQSLLNQTAGNFVTAFYGVYDSQTRLLTYAGAGHPVPFLLQSAGLNKLEMPYRGFPLGVFGNPELQQSGIRYENTVRLMAPEEKLLIYTDGILETSPLNKPGFFFSHHGLSESLMGLRHKNPRDLIEEIYLRLKAYRGSAPFEDDLCMVCLKC